MGIGQALRVFQCVMYLLFPLHASRILVLFRIIKNVLMLTDNKNTIENILINPFQEIILPANGKMRHDVT